MLLPSLSPATVTQEILLHLPLESSQSYLLCQLWGRRQTRKLKVEDQSAADADGPGGGPGCAPVHTVHTAATEASLSEGPGMGRKPTESIVGPENLGIKDTENCK